MAMNFELCDSSGVTIADANTALQRVQTYTRNKPAEVQIDFDLESTAAMRLTEALANGIPRLRVWEDNVLWFYGKWFPMREQAREGDQTMQVIFRGADAVLENRFTAAQVVFTATDAGAIGWALINTTNGVSNTGIITGSIATTTNRDRTYERKQVLEAIAELTEVLGGFDYEVVPQYSLASPVPATLGAFTVYSSQGTDRSTSVVFEYGPNTIANVTDVTRTWSLPVNLVTVLGANDLVGTATDAASVAKYGQYETQDQATDVVEQATVNAKATALLRPDPVRVVEFTPDSDVSWQPKRDYWLGDRVALRARIGSLNENTTVRVNQITVALDADDHRTVTLAIEGAV